MVTSLLHKVRAPVQLKTFQLNLDNNVNSNFASFSVFCNLAALEHKRYLVTVFEAATWVK